MASYDRDDDDSVDMNCRMYNQRVIYFFAMAAESDGCISQSTTLVQAEISQHLGY